MPINKTAKILIATGATLLTGALFFGRKAKAASLNQYTIPAQGANTPSGSKIITNHDAVYDYKYDNNKWYTRKKGTSQWIDMQSALSPESYKVAVARLQKHL